MGSGGLCLSDHLPGLSPIGEMPGGPKIRRRASLCARFRRLTVDLKGLMRAGVKGCWEANVLGTPGLVLGVYGAGEGSWCELDLGSTCRSGVDLNFVIV